MKIRLEEIQEQTNETFHTLQKKVEFKQKGLFKIKKKWRGKKDLREIDKY